MKRCDKIDTAYQRDLEDAHKQHARVTTSNARGKKR
jgi:hypothetical protein